MEKPRQHEKNFRRGREKKKFQPQPNLASRRYFTAHFAAPT
jgi:hypothetical protein